MAIPTRKEWQKIRDNAGGKQGLSNSVSVGKSLDAYHSAAEKAGVVDSIRPLNILEKALKTYVSEVKKESPKLAKAVEDKVLSEVEKAQAAVLSIAKYPGQIMEGVEEIDKVMKKKDWADNLQKMAAVFRLIRTAADKLVEVDPDNRWAQVIRVCGLAHADIEKLDKLYDKKLEKQDEKTEKQMKNTEATIDNALIAIEKHCK